MFTLNPTDSDLWVSDYLKKRGVSTFWIDQIMESIRSICIGHNCKSAYSIKGVNKDFPLSGSFRFIRVVDNKTFKLRIRNNKWICN